MIQLNIIKKTELTEAEKETVYSRRGYGETTPVYNTEEILSVEITEEQFEAIRKAVIETF